VLGQANELGQAVLNLLVNALDAIGTKPRVDAGETGRGAKPRGHVEVRIEQRPVPIADQITDQIVLSIADDGPGVRAEELARVADLFYTTKDVGKGTGLGLSIVHGVVTSHGGRVHLESTPGVGFRVELSLPIWTATRHDAGSA
jgi:signal transduction histidine kinase